MSHPCHTLICVESFAGGGAERVAIDLAINWPRSHSIPVLLVANSSGPYSNCIAQDILVLEVGIPSSPWLTLQFLKLLKSLLCNIPLKGVISHMTSMNRMILRAKLFGVIKAPVVVVEHNNFLRDKSNGFKNLLLNLEIGFLYKRAHAVVGCSKGVAEQIGRMFSIDKKRLTHIYNPVDAKFFLRVKLSWQERAWFDKLPRPIITSSGRLVPQKGFHDLISAFSLIDSGSLIIMGDGPLRNSLEKHAESLGLSGRVVFAGFLNTPQAILQASDIFVSASYWDGYPLVLNEAYASGIPVVARACDFGPSEIVLPGRPGKLVFSNSIMALASAITDVLSHQQSLNNKIRINLRENSSFYVASKYASLLGSRYKPMCRP